MNTQQDLTGHISKHHVTSAEQMKAPVSRAGAALSPTWSGIAWHFTYNKSIPLPLIINIYIYIILNIIYTMYIQFFFREVDISLYTRYYYNIITIYYNIKEVLCI
jgi:hypothetical protein